MPNFLELRTQEKFAEPPLLGTRVNKGKKKGRSCYYAPALKCGLPIPYY
jgi:hypothetical protein